MNDELENDELEIASTNGGSIATVVGGLVGFYGRENSFKMPPKTSIKVKIPKKNKDFMTIPLIPNKEPNKEPNRD